jgi:hypothetical protein
MLCGGERIIFFGHTKLCRYGKKLAAQLFSARRHRSASWSASEGVGWCTGPRGRPRQQDFSRVGVMKVVVKRRGKPVRIKGRCFFWRRVGGMAAGFGIYDAISLLLVGRRRALRAIRVYSFL